MTWASPEDPGQAPVWENYVVAQASEAALGLIPLSTLALCVRVRHSQIELRFYLTAVSQTDLEDIDDITDNMETLLGPAVQVSSTWEIRSDRSELHLPRDGIRCVFMSRVDPA